MAPGSTGENTMRALILAAGAALTLAACGGGSETANTEANAMAMDNMSMDTNMTMDANMTNMDMNMGGMDANMATNGAAEANMMANDMNTNSPDTNLANGM
jgi:hypothetical protein